MRRIDNERRLRAAYYNLKSPRGFGGVVKLLPLLKGKNKRQKIQQWLRKQESYALHFPVRRKYRKQKIQVQGIHQQWEADLTFVRGNKSKLLPILMVIDCLSRRADARVLKSKKPEHIADAFNDILQESPFLGRNKAKSVTLRHPYSLRTDQGLEFRGAPFQRLMKAEDIHHFYALNPDVKAAMVERLNRTIRTRLQRYMTHKNIRYLSHSELGNNLLPKLMHAYNYTPHRSLNDMRPIDINIKNKSKIILPSSTLSPISKFNVGDHVRISVAKGPFAKGYHENYSRALFTIVGDGGGKGRIQQPALYTLEDSQGERIRGRFYAAELLLANGK